MYAAICKNVKNTHRNICKMLIAGFIGQLRGWWDNYMSLEQKVVVINAILVKRYRKKRFRYRSKEE